MKVAICALLITIFSLTIHASDWVSPIDTKYSTQSPDNFVKFTQVRGILDSWRGERSKLEEAHALLEQILKNDQTFAPAHRELGRLFLMAGYVNSTKTKKDGSNIAEQAILHSIELEPEYADAHMLLGHLYTVTKQYQSAAAYLHNAEYFDTKSPWLPVNLGTLYLAQGKYKKALNRFQYIIATGTINKKAYTSALHGVTKVYLQLKQYDKANESYKAEISYEPESAWKWGNYSSFLLFQYNDVDGAIENGQKAISIKNYSLGRFHLACALYSKWAMLSSDNKTQERAKHYFKQAWALYPNPMNVIDETQKYAYTKVTAVALQKWLAEQ